MKNEANADGISRSERFFCVPLGWCVLLACLTVFALLRIAWNRTHVAVLSEVWPRYQVEINSASREELQVLPEVGDALATRIILHRESHGPFREFEDLLEVRGVGDRTLELLRPMLVIWPNDAAEHAPAANLESPRPMDRSADDPRWISVDR